MDRAVLGASSPSWQFLQRQTHLPDHLTNTATLGFPFGRVEAATPIAIALASGCARRQAAMHPASTIRHCRAPACRAVAPINRSADRDAGADITLSRPGSRRVPMVIAERIYRVPS